MHYHVQRRLLHNRRKVFNGMPIPGAYAPGIVFSISWGILCRNMKENINSAQNLVDNTDYINYNIERIQ